MAVPHRILVTGASGFVGCHLVPLLRAAFPAAEIVAMASDITVRPAVEQAVRDARPDACIHLAAISTVTAARQDPEQAWRVNLQGTLNLAEALIAHAPASRMIFASSGEIYGRSFQSGRPLDETALPAPMNTYAATKAAADLALGAMANGGLQVVRLRLFNHTGPGQSAAFVVPAFAQQIARIEAGLQAPPLRVGALDPVRDFLDVRDVCAAYVACLRAGPAAGTILNIASGEPRRIGDMLEALLALAGLRVEVVTDTERLRPAEIKRAFGDAGRAREMLGWVPSIPWEHTLRDVLADWRSRVHGVAGCPADGGLDRTI
jgi:GDP-4-dehydro-6-deoxy-D-mannose reductase